MIGLMVFFALAIPLAIHMLSRSHGKIIPFPFIGLLPKQSTPTELQIHLRQKRLLLIRLLLVASACLLVSASVLYEWWQQSSFYKGIDTPTPTVVISQDWWELGTTEDKQSLLSALQGEKLEQLNEVFLLAYSNPQANNKLRTVTKATVIEKLLNNTLFDSAYLPQDPPLIPLEDMWSIAQLIGAGAPLKSNIYIYSSNRYSQFVGVPLVVEQTINWELNSSAPAILPTNTAELKVALIGFEEANLTHQQQQRMAWAEVAIESLMSVYPITISKHALTPLNNENDHSWQTLAANYDALVVDNKDKLSISYTSKLIELRSLPPYSQTQYIADFGKSLFASKQQEYTFLNTALSPEQIRLTAKPNKPSSVAPLSREQSHPWQKWLILLMLILFVAERLMSEWPKKTQVQSNSPLKPSQ